MAGKRHGERQVRRHAATRLLVTSQSQHFANRELIGFAQLSAHRSVQGLEPRGYNQLAMNASGPCFQLFWLRESGCDAGTPIEAAELPASIRKRVLQLAGTSSSVQLRLPYLDRREERHAEELLGALPFERTGDLIRSVLEFPAATRDMAATCALTDPLWSNGPSERDATYFGTWQRVSLALQRWLRDRVAEAHFSDAARIEDRPLSYPIIVYQAARPYFGKPRTEFTYDLRDFPWCDDTLAASWNLTGRHIQRILAGLEDRVRATGQEALARRYSPVWHQDVLVAVQRKPKAYANLLAREAAIINAVIDLGTQPKHATIDRSAKIINRQLRKMHGLDLRFLGCSLFEEATRVLSQRAGGGFDDSADIWPLEDPGMLASGRPDLRIGG